MESHSEIKVSWVCPTGIEKLHSLMDGELEAESGDLTTDFHSGSKSLRGLGNLSQPSRRETGALGLAPLTAHPPPPGKLCQQEWETSWYRDKGRAVWAPKRTATPHFSSHLSPAARMTGSAFGDRMVLVPLPAYWNKQMLWAVPTNNHLEVTCSHTKLEDNIGPWFIPRVPWGGLIMYGLPRTLFKDAEHLNYENITNTFGLWF